MTLRARLPLADLAAEALAGLIQRPARSALTALGTVLGIGAFVGILGLTATAAGQIDKRFTALAATEVVVEDVGDRSDPGSGVSFPADATSRIRALNGVRQAGLWWPVPISHPAISAVPGRSSTSDGLTFIACEPGTFDAMHVRMRVGRTYDGFHTARAERVAVLGSVAATKLGVTRLDGQPAIFIDGLPFTVIGVIDSAQRLPELMFSIIIPTTTAVATYGQPREPRARMLIETHLGAAGLIARQAALALRPDLPGLFKVIAAPDPQQLRRQVTGDIDLLFLLLAAVSLTVGTVGIANTTLVGVLERTGEIGLRRSLGARPLHIAAQFLAESTVLGLLGGLAGTSLGIVVVVAVALVRDWTAILEPWTVLAAPAIGGLVGLAAGAYPALRAAHIEPVDALRR
jgi:putative ABC transport system permease protein